MKKMITIVVAFSILNFSIAAVPFTGGDKPTNASQIMLPIGKTGQTISLLDFSKLNSAEYGKLAHLKMNFFDRMNFNLGMHKLRKNIAADGTIKNKKLVQSFSSSSDGTSGFHLGGFALGFLGGLIGILIAYLAFKDEKKSNRIKWAWIGLGASVVLSLILVLLVFNKAKKTIAAVN